MDGELFELWFNTLFLPYAVPLRPLLVIMDGHSTHYQPSVICKAAEEQVILFCLPPHTTHLTQPLDKGCYGPLKMARRKECKDFMSRNPGRVVTRYEFSRLFGKVWEKSKTITNVIAGFRCTGIYPFNPFHIYLHPGLAPNAPHYLKKLGSSLFPYSLQLEMIDQLIVLPAQGLLRMK